MPTTIPHADPIGMRADEKDDYCNTVIYALDDRHGLWRLRPSERRRSITEAANGAVVALVPDGTIPVDGDREPVRCRGEFVRWMEGEAVLHPLLPGVESPGGTGNPME